MQHIYKLRVFSSAFFLSFLSSGHANGNLLPALRARGSPDVFKQMRTREVVSAASDGTAAGQSPAQRASTGLGAQESPGTPRGPVQG